MDAHERSGQFGEAAPPISVLFCADPVYVQHLAVAATSLARSNRSCKLDLHLFTHTRDAAAEDRLRSSLGLFPHVSLTLHPVSEAHTARLPVGRYWTRDIYLRYLAPAILPAELRRVIYLDCDLVVLDDIGPLWRVDLAGRALGAAPDFPWDPDGADVARRRALGLGAATPYVNSGVLLFDLARWRAEWFTERLFDFAEQRRDDLVFPDQDALNAVLKDDILALDPRWNLQARMYRLGRRACPAEWDATRNARRRPAILHYTTDDKPWLFRSDAPRKADYFRHLRRTDWAGAVPPLEGRRQRLEYRLGRMLLATGVDYMRVATRLSPGLSWRLGLRAPGKDRSGKARSEAERGAAPSSRPEAPVRSAASRTPDVSVIINNYNYGAYLPQAIESALGQDHPSFEVVVVDDGSLDDSAARIAAFGDRVRPVLQGNQGQAAAINAGVRASRGEILCFLDSDDWWRPEKLSRIAAAFDGDPGAVLAYHRLQPFRAGEARPRRAIPRSLCAGDIAPRLLRSAGWWPFPMTSAIAVRRSAWMAAGDIPESFRISADAWLAGLYPFLGRVVALPDALGIYRLHQNGWTRESDDLAMLARRMAHWTASVEATNRFFEDRARPERLDLADHLPLRINAARLRGAALPEQVRIAFAGLRFAGEPNPLRRLRDTLRTARSLADPRPAVMGCERPDGQRAP